MTSGNPLLGNRYRLTGRIATGGMGEVWRAVDELLGREVAVKLLRQHVAADPAFRERFRFEARITAGLTDSAIAQVFDYGEQSDSAYLVMELVPGEPLSAILARHGMLSAEVTLDMISQTAKGLHVAHRSGVIHRDIKPGNLLVTEAGIIKITDFGIARAIEGAPITRTGTVLGTAQYVSPEQASGSRLTPATDIYSLGVVAYECLTGRPPFIAETQVGIALLHLNEPPPPLPDSVPAAVRTLVMSMLSKAPEHRPAGAQELSDRAFVLRDSLTTSGAGRPSSTDLSMVTDPAGVLPRARDVTHFQQRSQGPQQRTHVSQPRSHGSQQESHGPEREGHGGRPVPERHEHISGTIPRSPSGRSVATRAGSRRSRTTITLLVAAGCAATVGMGVLAVNGLRGADTSQKSGQPAAPATEKATPSPSSAPPRRATVPIAPGKSVRPIPSPSATVSTTAVATPRPSPTKSSTPTPTPIPTTPTPTPSETPTPTSSPSMSEPPIGET